MNENRKYCSKKADEYYDKFKKKSSKDFEIYHYCPYEAFEGIIKTKEIWMNNASKMSDKTEMKFLTKKVAEIIDKVEDVTCKDKTVDRIVKKKLKYIYCDDDFDLPFIASFSLNGNLKYQWENYADSHKGVCIKFSYNRMKEGKSEWQDTYIPSCKGYAGEFIKYVDKREKQQLNYTIDENTEKMKNPLTDSFIVEKLSELDLLNFVKYQYLQIKKYLQGKEIDEKYFEDNKINFINFMTATLFFKDNKYSEEKEFRIFYEPQRCEDGRRFKRPIEHSGELEMNGYVSKWKMPITTDEIVSITLGKLCNKSEEDIRKLLIDNHCNPEISIQSEK